MGDTTAGNCRGDMAVDMVVMLVYVVVVFHCPETVVGDAVAVLCLW